MLRLRWRALRLSRLRRSSNALRAFPWRLSVDPDDLALAAAASALAADVFACVSAALALAALALAAASSDFAVADCSAADASSALDPDDLAQD